MGLVVFFAYHLPLKSYQIGEKIFLKVLQTALFDIN